MMDHSSRSAILCLLLHPFLFKLCVYPNSSTSCKIGDKLINSEG